MPSEWYGAACRIPDLFVSPMRTQGTCQEIREERVVSSPGFFFTLNVRGHILSDL